MKRELLTSLLGAVATAIGFAVGGAVWGFRVLGAFVIFAAAWTFWTRRAAYVLPDKSGDLTGRSAVVAGVVNLAIGVAIIINAEELAAWVRRVIPAS